MSEFVLDDCPNCGQQPTDRKGKERWVVECSNADCTSGLMVTGYSLADAKRRWNDRFTADQEPL